MSRVKRILVSTYGRAARKLNVARKHLPHDRLVLVCDRGADVDDFRTNEEERGGEFVHIAVDPYDFDECLKTCYKTLENLRDLSVVVNVSIGPKTLVGAMMFAAFHAGVEVYHCDVNRWTGEELVIRLPTFIEFELRRRFTDEDWRIIKLLRRPRKMSYLAGKSGMGEGMLQKTLARLENEGVMVAENRDGRVWVVPTVIGRFFSNQVPDH